MNKLYDRDEISNTVMSDKSKFNMRSPWVIFLLAMHLEELKTIFGKGSKDTCNIFSRFDFFHREGTCPSLSDYNDMSEDEAITYLADIMQLIEISYPKSTRAEWKKLPADMQQQYSLRKHLWKVSQANEFFEQSFEQHTKRQRAAMAENDRGLASHESKQKTKECRYSCPVDALIKAFKQKAELEKYRAKRIIEANAAGRQELAELIAECTILALRQDCIDKDEALATTMGLPLWKRGVTKEAAEIGHLITFFLGSQTALIKEFVLDAPLQPSGTNTHQESGQIQAGVVANGTGSIVPVESPANIQSPVELVLPEVQIKEEFKNDIRAKIIACIAAVVKTPLKMVRLSQVKCEKGRTMTIAVSLLHHLGLIQRFSWKKTKSTSGGPATFLIKNHIFENAQVQVKILNFLHEYCVVSPAEFKQQEDTEQSRAIISERPNLLPMITAERVTHFMEQWTPYFKVAQEDPAPDGPVAIRVEAAASSPNVPVPLAVVQSQPVPPAIPPPIKVIVLTEEQNKAAAGLKASFKWIFLGTDKQEISRKYFCRKMPASTGKEAWPVIVLALSAMGLGLAKTVGKHHSLQICRPPCDNATLEAIVELGKLLGPLGAKEKAALARRINAVDPNADFKIEKLRETIASIQAATE